MSVSTYDPQKVIVTFLGSKLGGFADGTFIEVERASDTFSHKVGADGEVARAYSADKSATVKITLLQTSASNDILAAAEAKDALTKSNTGPLLVKDASGRTVAVAADAWVQKPTAASFSKEIESREWTIVCAKLDQFVGGN